MSELEAASQFDATRLSATYWRPDVTYEVGNRVYEEPELALFTERMAARLITDILILSTLNTEERDQEVAKVLRGLGYIGLQQQRIGDQPPFGNARSYYHQSVWLSPRLPSKYVAGATHELRTIHSTHTDAWYTYDRVRLPGFKPSGLGLQVPPPEYCLHDPQTLLGTVQAMMSENPAGERDSDLKFIEHTQQRGLLDREETVMIGELGANRYPLYGSIALLRALFPDAVDRYLRDFSFHRANAHNLPTGNGLYYWPNRNIDAYGYHNPDHPHGVSFQDFTVGDYVRDSMAHGITAPVTVRMAFHSLQSVETPEG